MVEDAKSYNMMEEEVEETPKAEEVNNQVPGLSVMIMEQGEGQIVEKGDIVTVFYKGTQKNGMTFGNKNHEKEGTMIRIGDGKVSDKWE